MIDLGRLGSLRLHHWLASDDHRALHDHPSDFITLVLKGRYDDVTDAGVELMKPGTLRCRKAEHQHYVRVHRGGCWTLLYFRPKRRVWGFWVNGKFKKSNKYFFECGHHPCDGPTQNHKDAMMAYWYDEITAQEAAQHG